MTRYLKVLKRPIETIIHISRLTQEPSISAVTYGTENVYHGVLFDKSTKN